MDDLRSTVVCAQKGDAAAYGMLVTHFQDTAYGYAYARLGDFELGQDGAQEAFIEAHRCLPALREPLAFPSWFKRIVLKRCDPPLGTIAELWDNDRTWDPLRDDARDQQIWADWRARIGPIQGDLHCFPGW
jgi:hypothetical protein